MRVILITGGAGFIGSHAIEHFLKNYPDYIIINLDKLTYAGSLENMRLFIDNPRHFFIQGDICDKALLDKIFIEYGVSDVIHFAAESHVDNSIAGPDVFMQTNVMGTFCLLEAAHKHWRGNAKSNRFHHISTDEVYGSLGETGYFTEESPYRPSSPYSASKAASDHLVRSYYKTYGLNTVITNCSNNYGPHQHKEKFIPTIITKALAGEKIPVYGSGKNVRDWLYVGDHCEAIDKVFHGAQGGETFVIGEGNGISNVELTYLICQMIDKMYPQDYKRESLITFIDDRLGHDFRYAILPQKIKARFDWVSRTAFTIGLHNIIDFYMEKWAIVPI